MKTTTTKMTLALLALGVSTLMAVAQDDGPPPMDGQGPGGPGGHHRPPRLPIVQALDANHDGIIESNEIANASAELLTLDKNHAGQLTRDEYLPPMPADAPTNAWRPPTPPIVKALDVNGDGIIESNEIANAPAELSTLDKNHDGQLTRDEFHPRPPRHHDDQDGPPGNGQFSDNQGPPDNGQGPPDNGQGPPDNGQGPPNDGQGPPDNGQGPPDDGQGPPNSSQ